MSPGDRCKKELEKIYGQDADCEQCGINKVCGNDNNLYANLCYFLKAQSKNWELTFADPSFCQKNVTLMDEEETDPLQDH